MQLIYRGINYQSSSWQRPSLSISRTATKAKYRGATYYIYPSTVVCQPSLVAYKYRCIDYIKKYC